GAPFLQKKLGRNPTQQECEEMKTCNWRNCEADNEGNILNPALCEEQCKDMITHFCAGTNPTGGIIPVPFTEEDCKRGMCTVPGVGH
ncbi:hypothetical protein OFN63_34745, partial [Escherichia coli]|nr:hypothetical protein [Escherichia coli]